MTIREAGATDLASAIRVEQAAFGPVEGPVIARLVRELCSDPSAEPRLSLLAEWEGKVVGHVLFTAARICGEGEQPAAAVLAPLAVVPEFQRQGVGGRLVRAGLERLRAAGGHLVFVLGHPEYYPRHGFTPAGVHGFQAPYPIPAANADAWMVQELHSGALSAGSGQIVCADALNRKEYWVE